VVPWFALKKNFHSVVTFSLGHVTPVPSAEFSLIRSLNQRVVLYDSSSSKRAAAAATTQLYKHQSRYVTSVRSPLLHFIAWHIIAWHSMAYLIISRYAAHQSFYKAPRLVKEIALRSEDPAIAKAI
jgi:hypothetical protein